MKKNEHTDHSLYSDRQEAIKNFMPTIIYWAKFYHYRCHRVLELQDLVMVGVIGLMDAIKKFDKSKNNKLKTYAEFRIRGEIIDELRKQDWMSRNERGKHKQLREVKLKLTQALGRVPTHQEVANVLPFKRQIVDRLEQYDIGDTMKTYVEGETIELKNQENLPMEEFELKKAFEYIINDLPETMQKIIQLKYYQDMNFSEMSPLIHLSEGRICQIHAQAINLLKHKLEKEKIMAA